MTAERRCCPCCSTKFTRSKFRPDQRVCSKAERRRPLRTQYHRRKYHSDAEYRLVCRDGAEDMGRFCTTMFHKRERYFKKSLGCQKSGGARPCSGKRNAVAPEKLPFGDRRSGSELIGLLDFVCGLETLFDVSVEIVDRARESVKALVAGPLGVVVPMQEGGV